MAESLRQTANVPITTVTVALGERSYPIFIGRNILGLLGDVLKEMGARGALAICTDENVGPLYAERAAEIAQAAGVRPVICTMPAGEEAKRLARIEEFVGRFLEAGLDRGSVVVALGGGVVGDVAGYAAAAFMRGVRYIQVPTTIVAQVDSSVGGKTGVNHPLAKNVIGAFHQPFAVIIDMALLDSLPEREYRAGMAEIIKHGIIADAELFNYMEEHARRILDKDLGALEYPVRRSCEIKAAIVSADEREEGRRADLNYGHTFGHAIEAATDYGRFLHGEAIALGMCAAGVLARDLGLVDGPFVERQRHCIESYGLPVKWPDIPVDATLSAMKYDKKARGGALKFVLADRFGHVVHRTGVGEDLVRRALDALKTGR